MLLSPCLLLLTSKVALKPLPHAPQNGPHRAALARKLSVMQLRRALQEKPDGDRIARRAYDVGEAARIARDADPPRHVADLFAQLDHAAHARGAAGQHQAAGQELLEAGLAQ